MISLQHPCLTYIWTLHGRLFRRESNRPLYSKVIHSKSNFCSMDHKIFVSRCCCICWDLIGYAFCFTTAFNLSTADAYLRRGAVPYVTSLSPAHRCRHWRTLYPTGDLAYLRRDAFPYVTSLSPAHRCRHWRTLSPTGD